MYLWGFIDLNEFFKDNIVEFSKELDILFLNLRKIFKDFNDVEKEISLWNYKNILNLCSFIYFEFTDEDFINNSICLFLTILQYK